MNENGTKETLTTSQIGTGDLRPRLATYEAALVEIRDSKYCIYDSNGTSQYGIGVTDGHRCCSKIASDALSGKSTIADRLREADKVVGWVADSSKLVFAEEIISLARAYLAKWKERG